MKKETKQKNTSLLLKITTTGTRIEQLITVLFLVSAAILYVTFMLFDLRNCRSDISNVLKLISIIACALLSVLRFFLSGKSKFYGYLTAALCFTAISDYFLLFSADYIPGLISFCVVQTAYLALILLVKKEHLLFSKFVIRFCIAMICSIVLFTYVKESLLFLFPLVFYSVSFIANIVLSFQTPLRSLRIGLILFFLCDINVFLYNLADYISIPISFMTFFHTYSVLLIWFFYLPAQVILTLLPNPNHA